MNFSTPRLSIITVTYNDADNLLRTIDSVRRLSFPGLEFIIIDGNSGDHTSTVVEKNIDIIKFYLSEKDNGVFDAMNKGIKYSSGDWVLFLNAGDTIHNPDFFSKIKIESFEKVGLVYGDTFYKNSGYRTPFEISSLSFGMIMACHQSMLFNRKILRDELHYSDRFRLVAEYDLVCRIVKKGYGASYLNVVIANYLGGGISSVISWDARKARYFFVWKHFGIGGFIKTILESLGVMKLPNRLIEDH